MHLKRRSFVLRSPVAFILAGAVACHTARPPAADGTARMADTLASLYRTAAANPVNGFLNSERVSQLHAVIAQRRGGATLQMEYVLATEQLLAGQTRDAITGLEKLRDSLHLTITPRTKDFFDLLAIAWLRLGEQENCNLDPTSVCILGELHHTQQEGARKAIAAYEELLAHFPDDVGTRWLLNVAYMAVGEYPSGVPARWLIPNLGLRHDPVFPLFYNIANAVGADVTSRAGGLCVADFNNDGLLDLFTTSWGYRDQTRLLLADGNGGYAIHTKDAGLAGITGGINCVHADYDNDGHQDIFILRGGWLGDAGAQPSSLLHNNGDGTFSDVTFAARLGEVKPSHSAAWADFNRDGWLDLFVASESDVAVGGTSRPSRLFLNNRDGTFTDVSRQVGIDLDAFVKGVTWGDVDNDGLPDLYVSIFGAPNRLYMNRGGSSIGSWHFDEVAATAGVQLPYMSFPAWFWDYDNDGWDDILALGYDNRIPLQEAVAREHLGLPPAMIAAVDGPPAAAEHSHLYHNNHDGTFTDVTESVGLAGKAIYAMGSNFGDVDNDGWLDFYVGTGNPDLRSIIPNRMFRSVGGRRFEEVTMQGGFGILPKGHGTAFADLDRDGDEDVYEIVGGAYDGDVSTAVLFENPGWAKRNWITLDLEGTAGGANRSAIGARVEVVAQDERGNRRTIHRSVTTGSSFGSNPLQLHVGIGTDTRVTSVRVTWPDSLRSVSEYTGLLVRHEYRLVQGQPAELLDRPPVPFQHDAVTARNRMMPDMIGNQ